METSFHKVAIIGAGCAGLTATIYCARAELKPLVFYGNFEDRGGMLAKTSIVENYPGFPEGINGDDLIQNFEDQASKYGAIFLEEEITEIKVDSTPFLITSKNSKYLVDSIIIATGSKPNKLNLTEENKFWSNGISSCAVCDGALYKNKNIVVIGGGDSDMEEATFLTKFSNVTLIHRQNSFRASKAMQNKVLSNTKINIIYDTIITKLNGDETLESINVKNIKDNIESNIKVDGLFYGLGLKPNSNLFKGLIKMDNEGYIIKEECKDYETMTSIPGIFVSEMYLIKNTDRRLWLVETDVDPQWTLITI